MPRLTLDLSEAVSLKPAEDGTYPCEVKEIGAVQQGQKASYVVVTFVVTEGEEEGHHFFTNLMINGKAAGMFVNFINAVSGSDYDVDDLEDLDIDTDDLIGATCGVVNKQKEYPEGSGEFRDEVKKILPAA